jgi:hypothetical protein
LIEDIENVRSVKIRKAMPLIFNVRSVVTSNIGSMELHRIKPFLFKGQDTHYRLSVADAEVRREAQYQQHLLLQQRRVGGGAGGGLTLGGGGVATTATTAAGGGGVAMTSRAGVSLRKLGSGGGGGAAAAAAGTGLLGVRR